MHQARLNVAANLAYFDTGATVADPTLLTASVIDADDTVFASPTVTQSLVVADLYIAAAVTFTAVGNYSIVWSYDGTAIATESVIVGASTTTEAALGLASDYVLSGSLGADTWDLQVIGADGTEYVAPTAATFEAALNGHEAAGITIDEAGDYFFVWRKFIVDTYVPQSYVRLFVNFSNSKEVVTCRAATTASGGVPHAGARVVITDSGDAYVTSEVADSGGYVRFELEVGTYTASLVRIGKVYSVNNFTVAVIDTETQTGNNGFALTTDVLDVTSSSWDTGVDLCTLFGRFVNFDGQPMCNLSVVVEVVTPPQLLTSNIVWGRALVYKTDGIGYVEFDLVQGIEVDISVTELGVRRRITVPSAAGPTNFMTLVSAAGDQFDIVAVTVPTAPRRTL